MAKGDDAKTRNKADYNQARGETLYGQQKDTLDRQAGMFGQDYNNARMFDTNLANNALTGYQDFATTGGYGPTAISAMRSRALSPVRAAYGNAQREVNRALPSNNTAGRGVLLSRMAREQGQLASDAATNVEASLGQMIQQGRLAGLGGMSQIYGTTPGQSALFSRNVLENTNQNLNLLGNENQRMQGLLNTQLGLTSAPGTSQNVIGNLKNITDIGTSIFRPGK